MEYNKTKNENLKSSKQDSVVNSSISNPIDKPKILPLNVKTSSNRLFSGYTNSHNKIIDVNYFELINVLNSYCATEKDSVHLYYTIHNKISTKLNLNFSALGIYNHNSNCINIKLIDKTGTSYNSKVVFNGSESVITEAFKNKKVVLTADSNYLKLNYLVNAPTTIIPLIAFDECDGVMIFSDNNINRNVDFYKLIANYYAMFYKNRQLIDLVNKNTDIDSLTGLSNHKKLQEDLGHEILSCNEKDKNLAFSIIDIANISEINNELGHARGDAVIKEVAKKIKKNVRNTDVLGRYGGDKIGIIMPDTSNDEAKYVCEYLLYNLSCTMFDDLGQLKFSCGISMYPAATDKQEKLTILAEQALYIAKSKRNETGQSQIVSTNDYNFWDNTALKCFAQVLSKKHVLGINVEDELINQFHSEKIISNEHLLDVVSSLAATIDAKDTYTKGHSAAVSRYAEALARAIDLPTNEVERIKLGAMLHDIGKIGIPEQVLRKPTKLSDEEWEIMKQHPVIGADKVLKPNKSLHDLIPMVKYHHEHLDGSGYPCGLKGDEIPLSARIVAVADSYHALISDRPYRKGLSVKKACEILKMGAGTQWDKELVRKFIIIAPSLATII